MVNDHLKRNAISYLVDYIIVQVYNDLQIGFVLIKREILGISY